MFLCLYVCVYPILSVNMVDIYTGYCDILARMVVQLYSSVYMANAYFPITCPWMPKVSIVI